MALVKCLECGKMISDDAGACPQCGKPVTIPEPEPIAAPVKKSKAPLVIVLLLILGGAGGYLYHEYTKKDSVVPEISNIIDKKTESVVMYEKEVEIKEDEFRKLPLKIDTRTKVTVEFTTTSELTVDIFAVDDDNLKKFEDEDYDDVITLEALKSSGEAEGTIEADLVPGSYHLILDNTNYGDTKPPHNWKTDIATFTVKVTTLELK